MKIKKLIILYLLVLGCTSGVLANNVAAKRKQSLGKYSGYGGPLTIITTIKGSNMMLSGGLGVSAIDKLRLGGMGAGTKKKDEFVLNYGGGYIGYVVKETSKISLIPQLVLGFEATLVKKKI